MPDLPAPFVLLDDARAGIATLHTGATAIVEARTAAAVAPALARIEAAVAGGATAAGCLAYEAGAALEPRLAAGARDARPGDPPLVWFGLFDRVETLDAAAIAAFLGDPAGAAAGVPRPRITHDQHRASVAQVRSLIGAGDIYQANLTFPCDVAVAGDPRALYAALRTQGGPWSALVWTGAHWLLSASPELFFIMADGIATARPMKGTAARLTDPVADAAAAAALVADPKQRAENLMIVDLLRNDLSRVARPGGVAVPALFTRETYPTVHHLTSTVTARLDAGKTGMDVLRALFPCGSITGAPKIRAMEVIETVERDTRSIYTGSIGRLDPRGAAFNVAIRTLVWPDGSSGATLGLGSAIVADSVAGDEWAECLAKGAFVAAAYPSFDLIETVRFDGIEGFVELDRHLARMHASAQALGFRFDRHGVRNELQAASFPIRHDSRVRLRLARSGAVAIEITDLPADPAWPAAVRLAPMPLPRHDVRLAHKTSDRRAYDRARADAGTFEVVFHDPDGFITEGSFTSVFVERDGHLATPVLPRGLMPGTLRQRLIDEGRAQEEDIRIADLADGFLLGNALRGLFPAKLVAEAATPPL